MKNKLKNLKGRLNVYWKNFVSSNLMKTSSTSDLEKRIEKLEQENIELTNALYEAENRLQSQIDKIHPVVYHLSNS